MGCDIFVNDEFMKTVKPELGKSDIFSTHARRVGEWVEPQISAFDRQVGGNYYKQYQIQPYEFFFKNKITHEKAAIIRRILRYDQPGGKGLQDLEKIMHECQLLIELNGFRENDKQNDKWED